MKIYIETTIPSFLTARSTTDLAQAYRRETTLDWWNNRRAKYLLYTSQIVIDEISAGDPEAAARRKA